MTLKFSNFLRGCGITCLCKIDLSSVLFLSYHVNNFCNTRKGERFENLVLRPSPLTTTLKFKSFLEVIKNHEFLRNFGFYPIFHLFDLENDLEM